MKQMIVLVSVMVFSVAMFAGCDSKGKDCKKLYDKAMSCVKEAKMTPDKDLADKDKFMKDCKEHHKEAKDLMKMECKQLAEVFGEEPEAKPEDMKAEEKPAEEMKAEEKPAEPAPADMPAEPAPADMPAEEAK